MSLPARSRLWLAAVALAAAPAASRAAPTPADARPIDLVLCLDVSSSMNGLVDSAKLKLWDVVNELAKVKPTPNLRVALYSYGHSTYPAANGWVRKDVDLTTDLDEVYRALNALRISGGTELVARVSKAALDDQKWSTEAGAMKLLFVCGNEPADQDKEVTLEAVAERAKKDGVVINTIYCGPNTSGEARGWEAFAGRCGGKYLNIDQNKSARQVAVATEFDKEILELNAKLNTTYVAYGAAPVREAKQQNQLAQDANAAKAGAPAPGGAAGGAAYARAASKASALYVCEWDLVDAMKTKKDFDLKTIKEEELPEELRKIKPEDRLAYLEKKAAERADLQKKITDLSAKRQLKVNEELAKQPKSDTEKALDEAVRSAIREQAKARGFEVPAEKK